MSASRAARLVLAAILVCSMTLPLAGCSKKAVSEDESSKGWTSVGGDSTGAAGSGDASSQSAGSNEGISQIESELSDIEEELKWLPEPDDSLGEVEAEVR